jgi:hypothetical protein
MSYRIVAGLTMPDFAPFIEESKLKPQNGKEPSPATVKRWQSKSGNLRKPTLLPHRF